MHWHSPRTSAPDAEECSDIAGSIANRDVNKLVNVDSAATQCFSNPRRKHINLPAVELFIGSFNGGVRGADCPRQDVCQLTCHGVLPEKRASRQAIAALKPSRRAISMNSILSGDP